MRSIMVLTVGTIIAIITAFVFHYKAVKLSIDNQPLFSIQPHNRLKKRRPEQYKNNGYQYYFISTTLLYLVVAVNLVLRLAEII